MKKKIDKIAVKLTSHNMNDDYNIKRAIAFLLERPSMLRVCIQRLKQEMMFPIEYRLTVWYIDRCDWTPEMFLAEQLSTVEAQLVLEKQMGAP